MKKRTNKEIAKLLIRAQNASNGGKSKSLLGKTALAKQDYRNGYDVKDWLIAKAIAKIANERSGFDFYIGRCSDNTDATAIIYFTTKIDGRRVQMSFHTFGEWHYKNMYSNEDHVTRWSTSNGSSLEVARLLKDAYGINY